MNWVLSEASLERKHFRACSPCSQVLFFPLFLQKKQHFPFTLQALQSNRYHFRRVSLQVYTPKSRLFKYSYRGCLELQRDSILLPNFDSVLDPVPIMFSLRYASSTVTGLRFPCPRVENWQLKMVIKADIPQLLWYCGLVEMQYMGERYRQGISCSSSITGAGMTVSSTNSSNPSPVQTLSACSIIDRYYQKQPPRIRLYYGLTQLMKVKAKIVGEYKVYFQHILGHGMMGKVFLGQKMGTKTYIAVKEVNIKTLDEYKRKQIQNEIQNSSVLSSPYIVKLYDHCQTESNLYMFLEFCEDGDLKSYIGKRNGRLSEAEALVFFRHIVEGFKELCKHNIIHRDIKPANILLKQGIAKITDFGFSRVVEKLEESAIFTYVGTPLYTSPQILSKEKFSYKCDVWSVGVVLYEMMYGQTPWNGKDLTELVKNQKQQQLCFKPPVKSDAVNNLIRRMLALDSKDRISWEQIYQHPLCKQPIINLKDLKADYVQVVNMFLQYLKHNVVRGYLKLNLSQEAQSTVDLSQFQPSQINQFRAKMLQIFNKMLHQRNIAFFFNYILYIYYNNPKSFPKKFNFNSELEFVIVKTSKQLIQEIGKKYFAVECPQGIQAQLWNLFKKTSDFYNIKSIISADYQVIKDLQAVVNNRIKQVYIETKGAERIQKHIDKMDKGYWQNLFSTIIKESIEYIEKEKKPENVALLLRYYLELSLNPAKAFPSEKFDFHSFYEGKELEYEIN